LAEVLSFGFLAVLAETANRKRFAKALNKAGRRPNGRLQNFIAYQLPIINWKLGGAG
jgi:hypothetical protein